MNLLFKHSFPWVVVAIVLTCFGVRCNSVPPAGDWYPPVKDTNEAPVLSPKEALQSFVVPPGFRVELVAAEPLVEDPVAIDIDPNGRIWVVEMRGWMTDLENEEDTARRGRIVVLEDVDNDGRMDRRTVFMDGLNMPRGVLVLKDGVLVAEPPNLWMARDTDGDLEADERIRIRGDYGDPAGNPEAMANELAWGMDNWIHTTHYPGRFRHMGNTWQYDSTLALGQWGLAMGNYGRFFRTWNADPLRVAMIDPHYFMRNPNLVEARGVDVRIAQGAEEVWPIHTTAGVNRGYRESTLRENGTLRAFTAASAPAVYRGDRYPEAFQGNVFVPEPAANLVRRFEIIRHEDGTLEAVNAYDQAEFMASTDERFRPVNLHSAPDGTLYVVDMYRGVIEHLHFLTQYLRNYILETGLQDPIGLGRIYRIVYEPAPPRQEDPQLTSRSSQELVEYLAHPNGWWRDAAQQLLVERGATEVTSALRKMTWSSENELARLHALWALEGLGMLDLETARRAFSDASPSVRAAAVRLSESWLRKGDEAVLQDVAALAQDPSPEVRLQLAASLGEAPPPTADSALVALLTHASGQPYLIETVITGLAGRELEFLQRLVEVENWREQEEGDAQTLQSLSSTIVNAGVLGKINQMLQLAGDQADLPQWQRLALLEGIEVLIPGPVRGVERPLELDRKPAFLSQLVQADSQEVREKARKIADGLVWPGKAGYEEREVTLLTAAAKQQFEEGLQLYQLMCATCHQADGQGQEGVSVPLAGSEWVLGQEKDLIRIILGGKEGETGLMPPLGSTLSDEEVAAILTYIRNAWGNEGSPISPSTVEDVRKASAARERPWTEEELRVMLH